MTTATANALTLSGKALVFAGQQYLPLIPRQLSLTSRGDASVADASHVAALSSAPSMTDSGNPSGNTSSSSQACLCVVEWSEDHNNNNIRNSFQNEDQIPSTSSSRTSQVAVASSPGVSITSFASLAFGENRSGLSFPVSLSDDTVVLVSRVVDDDDGEVSYRKAGTILRKVGGWTASCVVQQGPHGGRIAAAQRDDSGPHGNVLSLIDVEKDRLEYVARLTPASSGLSSFPITQLEFLRSGELNSEVPLNDEEGYAVELLALCHSVILRLRCATLPCTAKQPHPVLSYYPKAQVGTVQVLNAWRWSPLDPIDSFAYRGHFLFAGTSEGSIAVWDMLNDATTNNNNGGLPVSQFLCETSAGASTHNHLISGGTNSSRRRAAGVSALVVRSDSELIAGSTNGLVSIWSSCGSKRWRSSNIHSTESHQQQQEHDGSLHGASGVVGEALFPSAAAAASSCTNGNHHEADGQMAAASASSLSSASLYGYPSIKGLASSHRYLIGMDDSGMLTIWQWLR
ncbi:Hypothetical protein, putative [Bodo saltans]|uniref:Uncharacterized protein n=1 Tax=Bodo saltans TaxID=75058 RepID=A0A0S4IKM9_BODSA|nr:Hypothetical protein, putative [Bodo saltans]|eukprot:CUE68048.1 Hypothetical protein, putative [Bodo saltans]